MPQRVRIFTLSEYVMCVCLQPLFLCVCPWDRKEDPLLGLCQHREEERMPITSLQRGNSSIHIHSPPDIQHAYKWFLLKNAVYVQNLKLGLFIKLMPLHWVAITPIMHMYGGWRATLFLVKCDCSAVTAMLTQLAMYERFNVQWRRSVI